MKSWIRDIPKPVKIIVCIVVIIAAAALVLWISGRRKSEKMKLELEKLRLEVEKQECQKECIREPKIYKPDAIYEPLPGEKKPDKKIPIEKPEEK